MSNINEMTAKLEAIAQHAERGWQEAHEQEARAEAAEKRVAELEARTVRLPAEDIGTAKEFYEDAVVVPLSVVNEACAAAGINLETGGDA
ncbi:hypothetical protein ACI00F_003819 [Cronobacter dublinensis]